MQKGRYLRMHWHRTRERRCSYRPPPANHPSYGYALEATVQVQRRRFYPTWTGAVRVSTYEPKRTATLTRDTPSPSCES